MNGVVNGVAYGIVNGVVNGVVLGHRKRLRIHSQNALQGVFLKGVAMSVSPCKNKPF